MDDFLGLEFLSTLKVFMRNHMNRAYLEFIDTLPFFMLQKVLVLSKSFHSKTYLEFIDTLPFFMLQKVLVLSKSFHSKTYLEGRKYWWGAGVEGEGGLSISILFLSKRCLT